MLDTFTLKLRGKTYEIQAHVDEDNDEVHEVLIWNTGSTPLGQTPEPYRFATRNARTELEVAALELIERCYGIATLIERE